MNFLLLCWEFFKIGLFAVGGGMATIPFLTQLAETHPEWVTTELLGNIIAIAESTPGPVGINMATYVGYSAYGIPGALAATFSLVLPSVIVIMLIAGVLDKYKNSLMVNKTFSILRPAVTGLIGSAGLSILKLSLLKTEADYSGIIAFFRSFSLVAVILFMILVALMQLKPLKKIHPILWIVCGAAAGLIFRM